uniref:Uncharacterized protein n=1 Tax=Opuntia streptacantha TaxID=393608 RepID=A0A7C9DXD1_OPUST
MALSNTLMGQIVYISHVRTLKDTPNFPYRGILVSDPELNAYTAHSPCQLSPATSSRNSTSLGITRPESTSGIVSRGLYFNGQIPAPWQLKTPRTPVNLFRFHIFIKLSPSITGSLNKQSRVGRPAYLALRIEPSGKTSFLRILKS